MANICDKCMKSENDCECKDPYVKETPEDEIEWVDDPLTNADYMSIAWHAIDIANGLDPMTEAGRKQKNKIIKKSLRIVSKVIDEIHSDLFDTPEED
jgi:hypothetical protein